MTDQLLQQPISVLTTSKDNNNNTTVPKAMETSKTTVACSQSYIRSKLMKRETGLTFDCDKITTGCPGDKAHYGQVTRTPITDGSLNVSAERSGNGRANPKRQCGRTDFIFQRLAG